MRDEKFHTERRRILNPIYTMSSTLEQEKYIDACMDLFGRRMSDYADSGEIVDLGKWLWMCVAEGLLLASESLIHRSIVPTASGVG